MAPWLDFDRSRWEEKLAVAIAVRENSAYAYKSYKSLP